MTSPCVNTNHFRTTDGELSVASGSLQHRWMFGDSRPAMVKNYSAVNPGAYPGDLLSSMAGISALNTNLTTTQRLMAVVTLDYAWVEWRSRSLGHILVRGGITTGTAGNDPAVPTLHDLSVFGGGCNLGPASGNANFGQYSDRGGPFRAVIPVFPSLLIGQKFRYLVEVRTVAESWDTSTVTGGNSESVSKVDVGEVRIDLFSSAHPIFFPNE